MSSRKWLLLSLLLIIVFRTAAQETCSALVQDALSSLDTNCDLTERNQACYGNISLTATSRESISDFKFDEIGDIANLDDIDTLDLEPMDEDDQKWGLVMMRVQADIPDSLPGQNVTFILFGDVEIENQALEDQTPMQAFYLTTGIGDSKCAEAPESGLMVQTPDGVKEVVFNVNGVDVQMGSTVVFQAEAGEDMVVKTLEGKARLKIDDEIVTIVQGTQYTVPVDDELNVTGEGEITPYEEDTVDTLPIDSLDREIEIAEPLTKEQIEEIKALEEAGEPLCSDNEDSYLPPCTKPIYDINGDEIEFDDNDDPILVDEDGNPLLYDETGEPITSLEEYERFVEYWEDPVLTDDFSVITEDDGIIIPDATEEPAATATKTTPRPRPRATATRTPIPTDVPPPTDVPTNTYVPPTYTPRPPTDVPTTRPRPTLTPTYDQCQGECEPPTAVPPTKTAFPTNPPPPTNTPACGCPTVTPPPPPTDTPLPPPTDTPLPPPTDTPLPPPTDTPLPPPTDTPVV